ncbi:MAG: ClpXP protease specificity-enhancing factor SspB, partial [Phaeobacter gallaeciensis]
YDAIKTFVDPSVEFGLRFETAEDDVEDEQPEDTTAPEEDTTTDETAEKTDAEVVSLDSFRK